MNNLETLTIIVICSIYAGCFIGQMIRAIDYRIPYGYGIWCNSFEKFIGWVGILGYKFGMRIR